MHDDVMIRPPRTIQEVFEQLPEGTMAQLIEKKLIISPAPLDIHQKILDKIYRLLGNFVENNNLGVTRVAPYDVHFDNNNIFQPDIIFIANENLHKIQSNGLYGAPDVVIEILSASSIKYDLGEKKKIYEQYGVKEYWVIDPVNKNVQGFFLNNNNQYAEPVKSSASIHSPLLNTDFYF